MQSRAMVLQGGLDTTTPTLQAYAGSLRDGVNFFESTLGGYERIGGNEVFDGRLGPSKDVYYKARFNNWDTHVTPIAANTNITVGPLTMRVLFVDTTTEADTLIAVVSYVVGTIPDDLDITPINWDGVSSLVSITQNDFDTIEERNTHLEAAWNYSRSLVQQVPGDDTYVKGVLSVDDTVVAFRNTGTTPRVFYSSSAGWVEARIGRAVEITGYTAGSINIGENIATDTFKVMAVCDWYNTDDTPDVTKAWLVVVPLTAADEPSLGASTSSGGAGFTIASVLQPIEGFGENFDYRNHNFLANPDEIVSVIADGVNVPMCYSPQYKTLLPICSNFNSLSGARPAGVLATSVWVDNDSLIYSTGQGQINRSEGGLPFNFSGIYGAVSVGVGSTTTNLIGTDTDDVVVFTDRGARKIVGTDPANWQFPFVASKVGAFERSAQKLDDIYSYTKRGVASLSRADVAGDYDSGIISQSVSSIIKSLGSNLTCSTVMSSKEQVRWYFTSGLCLIMTRMVSPEGERFSFSLGFNPNHYVRGITTEVWSDGTERTFYVTTDGYVYEDNVGANFNGNPIYSSMTLQPNNLRMPANNKSYKYILLEGKAPEEVELNLFYDLNYGDKEFEGGSIILRGGEATFDSSSLFNQATYSDKERVRTRKKLAGYGFAIGLTFDHESKFDLPFRLTGYTLLYSPLGKASR